MYDRVGYDIYDYRSMAEDFILDQVSDVDMMSLSEYFEDSELMESELFELYDVVQAAELEVSW